MALETSPTSVERNCMCCRMFRRSFVGVRYDKLVIRKQLYERHLVKAMARRCELSILVLTSITDALPNGTWWSARFLISH